jgi:hypothetical protein
MVGGVTSFTVTVAVQVEVLLEPSVTVRITVLLPILEQLKEEGATATDSEIQLSVELLFTSAAAIDAVFPVRLTDTLRQLATGGVTSWTVITAEHVLLLPEASCSVSMTLLLPLLAQVKVLVDNVMDVIPQASEELLFTCAGVTVTLPPTSVAVTF